MPTHIVWKCKYNTSLNAELSAMKQWKNMYTSREFDPPSFHKQHFQVTMTEVGEIYVVGLFEGARRECPVRIRSITDNAIDC